MIFDIGCQSYLSVQQVPVMDLSIDSLCDRVYVCSSKYKLPDYCCGISPFMPFEVTLIY